jgi:very-short-patch-repair endonuclease
MCFKKSFASCKKSQFLIDNIDPKKIFRASKSRHKFKCNECEFIFESEIYGITYGRWCPNCKNKTEKMIHLYLNNIYDVAIHPKFNWCKNINYLPFDFLIDKYKLLIELDGDQHFFQVMNWKSPEENFKTDIFKINKAIENNYSIIRIRQYDFKYNNYDWKNILIQYIKMYDNPTVIFISKKINIYDKYIDDLKNKCKIIKYNDN